MQPSREVARVNERAECYAFPVKIEAEACHAVIICTVIVCDQMTNVLFDPSSTYYYVFVRFSTDFWMLCDILDDTICASTRLTSHS